MSEGNGTIRKTVDEHLSLVLPSGVVTENKTTEQGQKQLHIIFDKGTGSEFKLVVQSAGKEAELEEAKRNLKGRFHTHVEAKLGETQGLFGISQYFNVMVLTEHQRHPYVFAAYQGVSTRDDLTEFADRAASYLNATLAGAYIDGYSSELETMTGRQFLEIAGVENTLSEEEAQKEYLERLQKSGQLNGGVSFQVTRRNPITGRIERDLFWERAGAESGDPEAMGKLALAYLNGDGVEKDEKKAVEYMQKAADAGNATAQYNMGIFYFQGKILKKDLDQAQKWMEKAARSGDPDAYGVLNAIRSQKAEENRRKAEEERRKKEELKRKQQEEQRIRAQKEKEEIAKTQEGLRKRWADELSAEQEKKKKEYSDQYEQLSSQITDSTHRLTEMKNRKKGIGLFAFTEKSSLQKEIKSLETEIASILKRRTELEDSYNRYLRNAKKKQDFLSAEIGTRFVFGKDPNPGGKPLGWRVVGIQDNKLRLLSESTLAFTNYYGARAWMNSVFLPQAFTAEESSLLAEVDNSKVFFPTKQDVSVKKEFQGAGPTDAFWASIKRDLQGQGYTNLQKQNILKDRESGTREYWLDSGKGGEWAIICSEEGSGSIGAFASYAVRPLILIDMEKSVKEN